MHVGHQVPNDFPKSGCGGLVDLPSWSCPPVCPWVIRSQTISQKVGVEDWSTSQAGPVLLCVRGSSGPKRFPKKWVWRTGRPPKLVLSSCVSVGHQVPNDFPKSGGGGLVDLPNWTYPPVCPGVIRSQTISQKVGVEDWSTSQAGPVIMCAIVYLRYYLRSFFFF